MIWLWKSWKNTEQMERKYWFLTLQLVALVSGKRRPKTLFALASVPTSERAFSHPKAELNTLYPIQLGDTNVCRRSHKKVSFSNLFFLCLHIDCIFSFWMKFLLLGSKSEGTLYLSDAAVLFAQPVRCNSSNLSQNIQPVDSDFWEKTAWPQNLHILLEHTCILGHFGTTALALQFTLEQCQLQLLIQLSWFWCRAVILCSKG